MHEGFLLQNLTLLYGNWSSVSFVSFFKVGVGLKITHSEWRCCLWPLFISGKCQEAPGTSKRRITYSHFCYCSLSNIDTHYSSVPKMKISTSHFLELELLACCHNYCLNDTYSNGDENDAYLNRGTSTFIRTSLYAKKLLCGELFV